MSEVKRYTMYTQTTGPGMTAIGHDETPGGQWVSYEDYTAAQQALHECEAKLSEAQEKIDSLCDELDDYKGRLWCALGQPQNIEFIAAVKQMKSQLSEAQKKSDEADKRAVAWSKIAHDMLTELRQDYAPLALRDTDGAEAIVKLRFRLSEALKVKAVAEKALEICDSYSCTCYYHTKARLLAKAAFQLAQGDRERYDEFQG